MYIYIYILYIYISEEISRVLGIPQGDSKKKHARIRDPGRRTPSCQRWVDLRYLPAVISCFLLGKSVQLGCVKSLINYGKSMELMFNGF